MYWSESAVLLNHRLVIVSLCVTVLTGCGFKLRGTATLPDVFDRTRIEGIASFDTQYETLSNLLRLNDVQVVEADDDSATAVVRILGTDRSTQVVGVGSTGRARAFEMRYAVTFSAVTADGKTLAEPEEIVLFRSYEYDPTEVLGRENAEAVEFQTMQQDAAWQIVERLGAVK